MSANAIAFVEGVIAEISLHLNFWIVRTFINTTDGISSLFRIRYVAPVRKISSIYHDMYLIISLKGKNVQLYEKIGQSKNWVRFDSRNYFHIALVESEKQLKLKQVIEDAWSDLKDYYEAEIE